MKSILALLVFASFLPGCVVWEIRDEMRNVHAQLNEVTEELDGVNQSLESVQVQLAMLDQTHDRLVQVEGGLGRTNTSLTSLDQQLSLLQSIQQSLGNLDSHLLSLRKSIQGINRVVPFLNFGGDEIIEDTPSSSSAGVLASSTGGADSDDIEDDATGGPASGGPTIRDPLLGVWVAVRPVNGPTIIIDRERYLLEETTPEGLVTRGGTWAREGSVLILTPDAPASPASPAAPRGDSEIDAPAAPAAPPVQRWDIALQTGRSIAVTRDGQLLIFAKP